MIYKIKYKRKLKRLEIIVPYSDVWSGKYREALESTYFEHKEAYKVTEYREGLVISLPEDIVSELDLPELEYESKQKMKITEVFRRCQNDTSTVKQSS